MHAYPAQLADFVLDHWPASVPLALDRRALTELLSTCFQASLAHEEGRNVRFRLVSASPDELAHLSATDSDLLCLEFGEAQAFSPEAARRLSPAAPFHSSLVGVSQRGEKSTMWGIVYTGANWLAPTWGGRRKREEALSLPIVHVLGAGRIGVYAGADLVASLEHGMIEATTTDVFTSNWLNNLFRGPRTKMAELEAKRAGTRPNAELVRVVSQHMVRRAIFLIRQAGHGGLILFADDELLQMCAVNANAPLKVKYSFRESEARSRYSSLLQRLFEVLAAHGEGAVDLQRFLETDTPDVIGVEQSIFELSRLVSGLAAVDGAVVLNKRFELMGFGAEVSGELPYPDVVEQALDVEGERRAPEAANAVGTRHRAAYRFVTAHPAGLAIVISMDGIVRFVASIGGKIVFWDQFLNW